MILRSRPAEDFKSGLQANLIFSYRMPKRRPVRSLLIVALEPYRSQFGFDGESRLFGTISKLMNLPCTELKKKRTFRKFSYRGIDLDQYVLSVDFKILSLLNYNRPPSAPCDIDRDCTDSLTSPPNNSAMLSTHVLAVGSIVA